MLAGMVAPRGFLVFDNLGYEWLSPWSSYGCMTAARTIYKALGVEQSLGYSEAADHTHFQDQGAELDAFVGKYLREEQVDANVFRTEANFTFDQTMWIDWDSPDLT
ncbi:carbohydrate-binding module 1 [Exophiala oligosperma]